MLLLKDINKNWGTFSLKNINLTIGSGEYFTLLGPCGAGKTLLLETLCGLWKIDGGTITLDDKDITNQEPEKRNFGLIYQESALFPHLSVEENILYGLNAKKIKLDTHKKEMMRLIKELLRLDPLIQLRNPIILSSGQRQMVSIARALLSFPKVLLLDEPFHSLDYKFKDYLTNALKSVHDKLTITIIHVTHNIEEVRFLSSRIGFIVGGEIIKIGTLQEIKEFLKQFYNVQTLS